MNMVDWDFAVTVGSKLAGPGPTVSTDEALAAVAELREGADRSTPLVQEFTGLRTEAGTAPAYTYTCNGDTTVVLASRAVVGTDVTLANLRSTAAGATDYLRTTLTLPSTAGDTFQTKTSTISLAFTGTQRSGTNK